MPQVSIERRHTLHGGRIENSGEKSQAKEGYRRDGVLAEVLKLITENRPNALLGVDNACIAQGVFPNQWKLQKLTLISKGKGDTHISLYVG